jgi:hypothetical protein
VDVEMLNVNEAAQAPLLHDADRLVVVPSSDVALVEAVPAELSGLSAENRTALRALVEAPGHRLPAMALRRLYAHRQGMYRALGQLEARGLVERERGAVLWVSLRAEWVSPVGVHVPAP